jgi:hypothetical protein|tara:strand:- start:1880 stop:2659 length:780 start_codon:yes stop_codon:yes gene_type:complete
MNEIYRPFFNKMSKDELIDCLLKSEQLKSKYDGSISGRRLDEKYWTDILVPGLWNVYMKNRGSRSSEKTKYFHGFLQKYLEENIFSEWDGYEVFTEIRVESHNLTGKKNSDIVIFKDGSIFLIIPIKMIMGNYKQNKYNYFENLSGELMHLVLKNPGLKIVPLNIYFAETPYLKADKTIAKFEKITYENDLKNFDIMKKWRVSLEGEECRPLVHDVINYIFDVKHVSKIGEVFDKVPINIRFNAHTPFRSLESIFKDIV